MKVKFVQLHSTVYGFAISLIQDTLEYTLSMPALDSLLAVTGLQKAEKETNSAFSQRLYEAVKAADDSAWDQLDETAQEWFNQCHLAVTEGGKQRIVPGLGTNGKSNGTTGTKGGGLTILIRDTVFKNPTMNVKGIQEIVEAGGFNPKPSTIATTRAGFLGALQYLKDSGHYTAPTLVGADVTVEGDDAVVQ